MAQLVALDVAILPPPDVSLRAVAYSAAVSEEGSQGLRLDSEHLPHVTLTQQFVRAEELDEAFAHIDDVLKDQPPLRVRVTGAGHSGHTLWLAVERSPQLLALHERLMAALRGVERPDGGPHAFFEGTGRLADVLWVDGFRLKSAFGHFTPHVTIGHGRSAPSVEPFLFDATTIAACHLGTFCTCRRVLRAWTLRTPIGTPP